MVRKISQLKLAFYSKNCIKTTAIYYKININTDISKLAQNKGDRGIQKASC